MWRYLDVVVQTLCGYVVGGREVVMQEEAYVNGRPNHGRRMSSLTFDTVLR